MLDAASFVGIVAGGAGGSGGNGGAGNAQNMAQYQNQAYGAQQQNNQLGSYGQAASGLMGGAGAVGHWGAGQAAAGMQMPGAQQQAKPVELYRPPPPVTKFQPVTIESSDDQHTVMLDGMPVFRSADQAEARRTAETLDTMSEVMVRKAPEPMIIGIDPAGDSSDQTVTTTFVRNLGVGGGIVPKIVSGHGYATPEMCGVISGIREKIDSDYSKMFLVPTPPDGSAAMVEQQVKAGESRMAKMARKMGLAWPLT